MQSAPYLEGDNYYMPDNSKSPEGETGLHSSDNTKDIIDEDSLREQLSKTEEEIITLRQVLNVKLKLAQDLKRQLGITVINEMKGDIIHGINTIKESNTFKATTNVMKNVKDKTSTTLSTASSKFSQKIGLLRNTNTFKSIEGKMGTAYTSVKQSKSMGSIPNKLKVPCKYNPGDKIFAKVKGFVYWPARVNPLPIDITIPPNKIPIFFYGTHEVFFISPTSCWPYDEKNKSKWGKPRPRAHFNQGMDEIENKSTIYQYGVDPTAEDFLSQFYEFKRSNGQNTTPNKLNKQENNEVDNIEEDDSSKIKNKSIDKKPVSKKRNKSGSSLSMKENKNNSVKSNAMTELTEDTKSPESINDLDLSQSLPPPKKRQRSGSALSAKENTNCEIDTKVEPNIENNGVTTRRRRISSNDDSAVTNTRKSNKLRAISRKRYKNDSSEDEEEEEEEECESKIKVDNDDKSKINMECDLSDGQIKTDNKYNINQTGILELMPASVVKLENNLDNKLILEMLKKDAEDKESEKSNESCHSEQFKDNSIPKTRCASKSISKKVSNKRESVVKSETESDSLSVDSDNPDDEDFRPATKTKKYSKKIKSPKPTKTTVRKSTGSSQPKRNVKTKPQSKKKISSKVVSDDSLSSLSSVEEWNLPVEKKASEEKPKITKLPPLQLNDSKEISNKTVDTSKSTDTTNLKNVEISPKITKEDSVEKLKDDTSEKEKIAEDHENVEAVIENELSIKDCKSDEIIDGKEIELKVIPIPEDKAVDENNDLISDISTKKNQKDKEKKSTIVIDSGDEDDVSRYIESQEKVKKNKVKEIKANKAKSKIKPQLSRKRNRKLSSSSDSDVEIVKKESKPKSKKQKLIDRNSESDDSNNSNKGVCDKMQILQNFNVDIRSSLVLGKEDYKTCLERFKSLCEMQIDLLSLVKVWQLMDTVKKCRRYKRNEQIKQEAQSVYKRFMDIYTQASKDEIATAQSLLAQYRHQNNVQHQNVGVDSTNKSNGLSIPISVADMFQNRLSDSHPNKSQPHNSNKEESGNINAVSTVNPITDNQEPSKPRVAPPTEEEINEEKMRLLSIDLEAKVSDILNKIEKNVDVMNQKSLSHLLPSTDENFSITLPTQWKSVNEKSSTDKDNNKYDDNSDEDEEDVEAIVRRIEEVPIKLPEPEPSIVEKLNGNGGGSSSALDARIENLFNSSFITSTVNSKEVRQKKPKSSSRHHSKQNAAKPSTTSPSSKLDNQKLDHPDPVVIKNPDLETAITATGNVLQEEQKDDIEIYDLLGV